jgi:hypothetical protein
MTDTRLTDAYKTLNALFPAFIPPCPDPSTPEEHQLNLMELNSYAYRKIKSTNRGFPPGYWYMATLTSKPTDSKDSVLLNHKKVMDRLGDQVIHASLEKSNILHIHYLLCLKNVKSHLARDVSTLCQRNFKIEHVVTSLKRWNGACKYVLKRDYSEEKASTHMECLKEGILYEDGKGYRLKI